MNRKAIKQQCFLKLKMSHAAKQSSAIVWKSVKFFLEKPNALHKICTSTPQLE